MPDNKTVTFDLTPMREWFHRRHEIRMEDVRDKLLTQRCAGYQEGWEDAMLAAPTPAAQSAWQEAVYQTQRIMGGWDDVTQAEFERTHESRRRIVYTAPATVSTNNDAGSGEVSNAANAAPVNGGERADHDRLVRELDVLLNGERAASQASLCDIISQVRAEGIRSLKGGERELTQVIAERDDAEAMADKLASTIGEYFGIEIGEHSSANNPWQCALDFISTADRGCEICGGDCASANPPVLHCPMRDRAADAQHSDDEAVDLFAQAMKAKMADARAKGRSGWETCDPADLSRMLREHVEKGDPRDVANFCMMLWHHRKPISAADAQQEGGDDRPVLAPLVEPVTVKKAMLAGRKARAVLSGGTGPVAAVHLVNIGVTGWVHTAETADAYANGFNRGANWMQSALTSPAKVGGDEREAYCADMLAAGAKDLGNGTWEWDGGDFLFQLWRQARAALSADGKAEPEHTAIYLSKRLVGHDGEASFIQAHINQAVSEAVEALSADGGDAVVLEGLRAKLLDGRPVIRDEEGFYDHPAMPSADEDVNYEWLLAALGIETRFVSMEVDDPAAYDRYGDSHEPDCHYWTPTAPEGDGWQLLSVYDTEDGPYALFGRDIYAVEQARKKEHTRRIAEAIAANQAKGDVQ